MTAQRRSLRSAEAEVTLIARITGAFVRMVMVMFMITLPSMLLDSLPDARQIVALVALFAGALIFVEYAASHPSLISFRDAPPLNRLRVIALFMIILALVLMARSGFRPTTLSLLLTSLGSAFAAALDFPGSPLRLMLSAFDGRVGSARLEFVRAAAGAAGLIALTSALAFAVMMRGQQWPGQGRSFNVWVNLPTFDPTTGGDVVDRLERAARINVILGCLLPFLMPLILGAVADSLRAATLNDLQFLIWVLTAWSFLPVSLLMRGVAMNRIAAMIRDQRRLSAPEAQPRRYAAA